MRVQDQGDRRARAAAGMETSFEAALGAGENDFGHGCFGSHNDDSREAGALRRRVLYRGGRSCGNRQESTAFEQSGSPLSRPCGDHAGAARGAGGDAPAHSTPGPTRVRPMPRAAPSRALLEEARSTIAEALGWRHDVIFTSGASEAVEIAASRARARGARARRDRARDRPACDGRRVRRSFRSDATA